MKCPFDDLTQHPCLAMQPPHATRRHFLEFLSAGGVAVLAGGCTGGDSGDPEGFGDVPAGTVSDLPVGTMKRIAGVAALLARDDQGVYAMTNTCTHQGTSLPAPFGSTPFILCPSHGSRFDRNGAVIMGPAARPLVHYAVEIDASGNITVHGGTQVGAAVRVAP